jgi:hypothetical protein
VHSQQSHGGVAVGGDAKITIHITATAATASAAADTDVIVGGSGSVIGGVDGGDGGPEVPRRGSDGAADSTVSHQTRQRHVCVHLYVD